MIEEITIQELAAMEPSACQIIDMRDSTAFALGHIDGAVLIPQKELEVSHENLPKDKTLVIYCRSGIPFDVVSRRGILLVACHAGDGVVQNDDH